MKGWRQQKINVYEPPKHSDSVKSMVEPLQHVYLVFQSVIAIVNKQSVDNQPTSNNWLCRSINGACTQFHSHRLVAYISNMRSPHTHIYTLISKSKKEIDSAKDLTIIFLSIHPLRPFLRPLILFTHGYMCIIFIPILFSVLTINPASILLNDKKEVSDRNIRYDTIRRTRFLVATLLYIGALVNFDQCYCCSRYFCCCWIYLNETEDKLCKYWFTQFVNQLRILAEQEDRYSDTSYENGKEGQRVRPEKMHAIDLHINKFQPLVQ